MGWAEWMIVNQSLEEELELERNVRDVQGCSDGECVKNVVRVFGADQLASGQSSLSKQWGTLES